MIDHTTVLLKYKQPFGWDDLLRFFRKRQIANVEYVDDNAYRRGVRFFDSEGRLCSGVYEVSHLARKRALQLTYSRSLNALEPDLIALVSRQFDLALDPAEVSNVLTSLNEVSPNLYLPGSRFPGAIDPFEMCLRAILGQQITVQAARTLLGRIVAQFGDAVDMSDPHVTRLFPEPEAFMRDDAEEVLGRSGVIKQRAEAIIRVAQLFLEDNQFLDPTMDVKEAESRLLSVHGIGPWTTAYVIMRTLGAKDIFLATDAGIKQALTRLSIQNPEAFAKRFSPWRSYLTLSLWNSL